MGIHVSDVVNLRLAPCECVL